MIKKRKIEKSEDRKIEKSEGWKIEKSEKIGKLTSQRISKSGTNHEANERPKGESVAVDDLKAEFVRR